MWREYKIWWDKCTYQFWNMISSDFLVYQCRPCSFHDATMHIGMLVSKTRLSVLFCRVARLAFYYVWHVAYWDEKGEVSSHIFTFDFFHHVQAPRFVSGKVFFSYLSNLPVLIIFFFLSVKHKAKCSICKEYPIVGFRFVVLFCLLSFFFLYFLLSLASHEWSVN